MEMRKWGGVAEGEPGGRASGPKAGSQDSPSRLSSGSAGHAWPLPGWVRFYGATSTPYSLHIVHVSRQWGVVPEDPAWLAEPRTRLAVCRKRLSAPDLEGLQVGGPLATLVMVGKRRD